MIILGIETSCDDSSIAIVKNGRFLLSMNTKSQIENHNSTGGVVPEVAARLHETNILKVLDQTLKDADISIQDINKIAVSWEPGLISSLLIGRVLGNCINLLYDKKLLKLNHIEGHIFSNFIERDKKDIKFPALVFTASGGHNLLINFESINKYKIIGTTIDDAVGECFDKVSRMLGLGYPGGPIIEKTAKKNTDFDIKLPVPYLKNNLNFSFSGLKSAVLREIEKYTKKNKMNKKFIQYMCYEFQNVVLQTIIYKINLALKKYQFKQIHLAGGISCNDFIFQRLVNYFSNIEVIRPISKKYSTDNGAMIATLGYYK